MERVKHVLLGGKNSMNDDFAFATDLIQTDPWPITKHALIIGEVGINHNGDIKLAKQLIDMAKQADCDAVKFQKRTIDIVYTKELLDSPRESPWGTTQRQQKEGLEFGQAEYDEIDAYCRVVGIDWFASAWDVPSQLFLRQYKLKYNKIASPMLTHTDLLEVVAEERKPTFISTGMSTYEEIDVAVKLFRSRDCPFVLMHCISEYPAQEKSLNLGCLHELRKRYNCPVGYSGHEVTMVPGVIAVAMGAVAVERPGSLFRETRLGINGGLYPHYRHGSGGRY
jgi:N-acetylneuraminate synthase